jgi:hypothetical protein
VSGEKRARELRRYQQDRKIRGSGGRKGRKKQGAKIEDYEED